MRSNNMGFAAEQDFVVGSNAVGLIGDSYVEASMLSSKDRPAAQLERLLAGPQVYAMGAPGSSLLDYAERIAWANQTLGLTTFVVLMENSDASQALCNSGNVHAWCLDPDTLELVIVRRPPSSFLKDLLRESALAQYLNSQLKFSISRLTSRDFWSSGTPSDVLPVPAVREEVDVQPQLGSAQRKVVDASVNIFLSRLETLKGIRVVFAIDMNRENLKPSISLPDEGFHVAERLRARGYVVVHSESLFREHQRRSPLNLEVGPYDGHLNSLGIGLLMNEAAEALKKNSTNAE